MCVLGGGGALAPINPRVNKNIHYWKKSFNSRKLQFRNTTRKYLCIGGAGVGAKTIPSYGSVYPYKGGRGVGGQDLQSLERKSDPTPLLII